MNKRGPKPKGRVDITWRPELVYALGLIVADGSLSKDGRHIDFTSKDIDQLDTYKTCLGLEDIKIGSKKVVHLIKKFIIEFSLVMFYFISGLWIVA